MVTLGGSMLPPGFLYSSLLLCVVLMRGKSHPKSPGSLRMWPGVMVLRNIYLFTSSTQVMAEERFLHCHHFPSHPALSSHPSPLSCSKQDLKMSTRQNCHVPDWISASSVPVGTAGWSTEVVHSLRWQSALAVIGTEIPSARFCIHIMK